MELNDKMKEAVTVPLKGTIAFYILGVCTLLPWNFCITANSYWQYKLRNVSLEEEWNAPGTPSTDLQVSFTPALVIISNGVGFIFTFATSAATRWFGEKERIYGSLIMSFFTMATFTLLAIVNTDNWQGAFFGVTLAMVALLNVGISILQASLYGTVGLFSEKCITSLISGQALAGIISSLAQIISLAIGNADPIISGIIYFSIADLFIIISIGTYMNLVKMDFYKTASNTVSNSQQKLKSRSSTSMEEYIQIFKKISWMGFTPGFALIITLAIFPAVTVYITSTHVGTDWGDVYFQPTITFLLFNVMDMIGREAAERIQWPGHKGWLFHIVGACRIAFIPLLLLCYGDNKTFPTLFHQDFYYIIINFFFALSNGYIIGLAMIYYPRFVADTETDIAGALMATLMGVGMVIGSALSYAFVPLWGPHTS